MRPAWGEVYVLLQVSPPSVWRRKPAPVRGELAEPQVDIRVLTVGLFDGIATLRVAVDLLRVPLAGHVSVECNPQANRVVESAFRGSILVPNIQDVQMEAVMGWALSVLFGGTAASGSRPALSGC